MPSRLIMSIIFAATIFLSVSGQAATIQSCMFVRSNIVYVTVSSVLNLAQSKKTAGMACLKRGAPCAFRGCKVYPVPGGRKLRLITQTTATQLKIPVNIPSNSSNSSAERHSGPSAEEVRRNNIDRRAGNISGGGSYTDIAGTTHYTDGTSSRRDAAGNIQFSDGTYANSSEIYTDLAGNVHYGNKICYTDMARNTSCHK